ncbi:hypothetical protein WJX79_003842 [Trebouxia sp. C0005]
MFSDSSLAADIMSTADMNATDATTSMSTAVRETTDATPSNPTVELTTAAAIPFAIFGSSSQANNDADDFFAAVDDEDKTEQQSGFVPIPFGSSSNRPSFAATAVAAPFGSHADSDNMDDSFFDSIGTGEPLAVAPLAELQSQSGLISLYPSEPTPCPSYPQQLQAATELSVPASASSSPAAVALDLPEDVAGRQQGDSPQRQAFSIPFSGQSDPFAEGEDDLFGAGPSHEPGPFGATAPSEAVVESHAIAENDPNRRAPTLVGVSSGASQQHDSWAGQHVPSQGFSSHSNPLLSSHGANPNLGYSSGQGSEYRSPDGRPVVSLMLFGFAGKMYCWRPATSTSSSGITGGGNGFGASSVGTLHFLSWPRPATDTTPAQQQQLPQLSQAHQGSSMSATYALLTHFPGPLMPNTHKDKVLTYVSEACDSCLEKEPQCREPAELQLLWKVVQLLCHHKGDLHSALTPGVNDKRPEALLAAILTPAQTQAKAAAPPSNDPWSSGSAVFGGSAQGVSSEVLQPLPGFGDLQQAAGQMQRLLMAGHRLEALRVAVAGKLWGPALLLARHCSDKAFLETAAAMAEGSTTWRGNLAIMAANRVAGEEAAMVKLGDRLWQERSQAVAGHICYILAGLHTQPHGPASQMCLVGADHHSCPRRFATIPALQRSEVLEWARSQGNSSYTLQHGLMLLPYKFLYAAQLAEHGLISEAAQYCGAIQQALGAVPKLPPGLAVCRAFTQDLLERLQTYAAAHNIPLQMSRSGSVLSISGVGRWLDRGLSKLMGGPEQPPQSGPGSSGSTQSEVDPYVAKSKHRRNTSDQHLGSDTPKVIVPKRSQSSQDMGQLQHRSAKATPSLASTPEKDTDPSEDADNEQKASLQGAGQASNGQTQKAGGLGWGVMSRVASGLLGSGSKKSVPDKKVTEAKLGDENKFYYDNELKQWRVQGEEAPPPSGPPPPPPKMTPQRSASGSLAAGLTRAPSSGPPSTSGRPPLPGVGTPSSGPSSGGQSAGPRSAVRSRYVSNFSSASTSSPAAAAIPLVPPRAFGAPRAGSQPAQLFQPSAPASTSAPSDSAPKPDPLAASTNVKPDSSGAATSSYSNQQSTYDGPPKLIVFGGNGFVGTRVCEEALQTGLAVVSINRSGAPKATAPWTSEVEWVKADAFEPDEWRDQLQGAVGVVSCLGGFGSNDFMLKICGEANVGVIREAAQAGVPRCAFVSAHDYKFPGFVLSGYFQGKRNAEHAMAEAYPEQGVCLRPGFIHGTRYVSGVGIPLSFIGVPLDRALGFLPAKSLANMPLAGAAFIPPTSVQAVAKAAVAAATDPAVPGGIMDVWQIKEYEA